MLHHLKKGFIIVTSKSSFCVYLFGLEALASKKQGFFYAPNSPRPPDIGNNHGCHNKEIVSLWNDMAQPSLGTEKK